MHVMIPLIHAPFPLLSRPATAIRSRAEGDGEGKTGGKGSMTRLEWADFRGGGCGAGGEGEPLAGPIVPFIPTGSNTSHVFALSRNSFRSAATASAIPAPTAVAATVRTAVIGGTLEPAWEGARFEMALPCSARQCALRIELWDHNKVFANKFMSVVHLWGRDGELEALVLEVFFLSHTFLRAIAPLQQHHGASRVAFLRLRPLYFVVRFSLHLLLKHRTAPAGRHPSTPLRFSLQQCMAHFHVSPFACPSAPPPPLPLYSRIRAAEGWGTTHTTTNEE